MTSVDCAVHAAVATWGNTYAVSFTSVGVASSREKFNRMVVTILVITFFSNINLLLLPTAVNFSLGDNTAEYRRFALHMIYQALKHV